MIVSVALVSLCVKWSDTALVTQKQPNLAHFCVKTNLDTHVDSMYFNLPFFLDTARFLPLKWTTWSTSLYVKNCQQSLLLSFGVHTNKRRT